MSAVYPADGQLGSLRVLRGLFSLPELAPLPHVEISISDAAVLAIMHVTRRTLVKVFTYRCSGMNPMFMNKIG